ncbi:MAG TPA: HAMP domain-containing sensor histidine kinase [Longimicrobiales bacterium]
MADPVRWRKVRAMLVRGAAAPAPLRVSVLLFAIIVGLALWAREPVPLRLVLPGALLLVGAAGALIQWRNRRMLPTRAVVACWSALLLATTIAAFTTWHLRRVSTAWHEIVSERIETLGARLTDTMNDRVRAAGSAAGEAAAAALSTPEGALFARLDEIRKHYDVAAVAALDSATGELVAWAGEHRGPLPERLRASVPPPGGFYYVQRPLYTYLYAVTPAKVGGGRSPRGVVALLLETAIPGGTAEASLAEAFEERTGARPRFGAGSSDAAIWELKPAGVEVAHASFATMTQTGYRDRAARAGLRLIAPLLVLALLLLWPTWERSVRGRWRRAAPLLAGLGLLALLPLGSILGIQRPFSPGLFLLPTPGDFTLGRLFLLLAPITAWIAGAGFGRRPAPGDRRATMLDVLPAALLVPGILLAFRAGAAPSLLEDDRLLWFLYQPTVVLALALPLLLLLPARERPVEGRAQRGSIADADARCLQLLAGALALAALMGVALDVFDPFAPRSTALRVLVAALWAAPFALAARALRGYSAGGRLLRFVVATFIAATAALPQIRAESLAARMDALEREVATLGAQADPYLEFLVRKFTEEIALRDSAGERGVSLVYRAWVASGLAEEAYSPRITVWGPDGVPEVELTPGTAMGEAPRLLFPPPYLQSVLQMAAESGQPTFVTPDSVPDIQQIGAVALADERVATVVVPLRRALSRASVLEPLLRERDDNAARLTLRPEAQQPPAPTEGIQWRRTQDGWRGETDVAYPEAIHHAHLEVRTAPPIVRVARGFLLLGLDLLLVVALWFAGRLARLDPPRPTPAWRAWVRSYRGRVTAALFAFFLVPTLAFGAVAYRGLAGEVTRAARLVAERAVRRAVDVFATDEVRGDLMMLAHDVGTDVLYYHRGELLQASTPEALDLGLYSAWMPAWVYLQLRSDEPEVLDESRLGSRDYIVAYRSLPVTGALAVPAWPATDVAAARQTELAHLIVFAALLGALLSLALSLAVGRALTGPIGRLRRAAAAVGGGNLRVQLPERRPDEFGQLYRSFNAMIEQLRHARAQEVRTARVLAWGEMARQVAHEIKNPLTPIRLAVQHMRRAYDDRRPDFERILETNVEQILKEIDRLSEISRVFARYGAPAEAAGPLERVRVPALLGDIARLYSGGESDIRFTSEVPDTLPDVRARSDELKEVMINLLENAREALDGAGEIRVVAREAGDYVAIEVRDNGPGIPPDLLPRIFEPTFSSRSSGTGLGLAIVRRLVDSWGGMLEVDSAPGRGTRMVVSVRRADGTAG